MLWKHLGADFPLPDAITNMARPKGQRLVPQSGDFLRDGQFLERVCLCIGTAQAQYLDAQPFPRTRRARATTSGATFGNLHVECV